MGPHVVVPPARAGGPAKPGTVTGRAGGPAAPPGRAAFPLGPVVAFVGGLAVLAARAPQALSAPRFWAEDGVVFFAEQHGRSLPQLFEPYAGYLHLIPRLVAWAATALPSSAAPAVYSTVALLVGAGCLASLRVLRCWGLSLLLVLAALALTPTNGEVYGTLTNVQWLTQFYLLSRVVVLVQGPPSRRPLVRAAALVPVALTGPFCAFATVALAVGHAGRVVVERRRGRRWRPALTAEAVVLVAATALQALMVLRFPPAEEQRLQVSLATAKDLLASIQPHVLGGVVAPNELFLVAAAALVGLAAWRFRASPPGQQAAFAALVAFLAAQLVATVPKSSGSALVELAAGDRYFVLLKAATWWFAGLALIAVLRRTTLANVVALAALVSTTLALGYPIRRADVPDLQWGRFATEVDAGRDVTVPIWPPGWILRCTAEDGPPYRCWASGGPPSVLHEAGRDGR